MKVGIIAVNNMCYSPYIFFHTRILETIGIDYDIIIPDRNAGLEQSKEGIHVLPWNAKHSTLLNYVGYAQQVKKLVKRKKYDALVALTANSAAFLAPWLKKHYAGRYVVDIRDYSHENIKPFYWLEKLAIKHSFANVLSSAGFQSFLPKAEYLVCHNLTVLEELDTQFIKAKDRQINIGYVGAIGYVEQCKRLMQLVQKDERFCFSFYGTSGNEQILRQYAEELSCDRIKFYGRYNNQEKAQIIQKVDILFNAYGNGIPLLDYALSNKLYDAMAHRKPIITSPNTYMDEAAGILSFPIDLAKTESLDGLYSWYIDLDSEAANTFAQQQHLRYLQENEAVINELTNRWKKLQ